MTYIPGTQPSSEEKQEENAQIVEQSETQKKINSLKVRTDAYYLNSFDFQKRRHDDWATNYRLYRDKIITNRLTQRQTTNVPLMKETVKTALSNIDDAPDVMFEDKGNDETKEIYINEYWEDMANKQQLEIKDIIDKRQVLLYGRSFKKLNIKNKSFQVEILDPIDVIVDRFVDPADIDTANYLCHQHIYRALGDLYSNSNYDRDALNRLQTYFATETGKVESTKNAEDMQAKNQKMKDLGLIDTDYNLPGETIVELKEHFIKDWDKNNGTYTIYVLVEAGNEYIMCKPLEEVLGINFFPFEGWGDEVERTDYWSDGMADVVRGTNIIANSWVSQLSENRTLINFNMNYYDATDDDFFPETFEPKPWGWYPIKGDPNKKVKSVKVEDLADSLNELTFLTDMVARATAVTGTMKGESQKGSITLGEIELIDKNATKRITSMNKFYKLNWQKFAYKWYMLLEANADSIGAVELSKKGKSGKYYSRYITPANFKSEKGFKIFVTSKSEETQKTLESLQKYQVAKAQMPNNKTLDKLYKKKILSILDLSPEDKADVMEEEERLAEEMAQGAMPVGVPPVPAMTPANQ